MCLSALCRRCVQQLAVGAVAGRDERGELAQGVSDPLEECRSDGCTHRRAAHTDQRHTCGGVGQPLAVEVGEGKYARRRT